ncbi:hypothetical protein ACRYCC_09790 [Actinomadura scrupuli]|uniref:hypothetical protein n=1 Tax=Actinomadura scrupuli TaxID=559629 RepID=UPI003D9920F1
MILLAMIATLSGAAVFVIYLLEFALTTRRDQLSADTRNAATRRARRAVGIYVRRSQTIDLGRPAGDLAEPVDPGRTPVP